MSLTRMAAEIGSATDASQVLAAATAHAVDGLGALDASLALVVSPTVLEVLPAGDSSVPPERIALDGDDPVARAVRTPQVVTVLEPGSGGGSDVERTGAGPVRFVLPLVSGEEVLGALSLLLPRSTDDSDGQLALAAALCAQALARVAAQAAQRERLAQMGFLTAVTAELASSLDYEATLQRLADLVVPELATWCAIDVLDDGALHSVAVAHVDPAKVVLARRMRERYPPDPRAATGAPAVARTGVPEIYEDIAPELLAASAQDGEHRRLALELDLRSAMIVPLTSRGRTLGVLTLVRASQARRYTRDDLAFAQELAHRAAVAVDNAEVHSQTLEVSLQLQRAILPGSFRDVPGWEVAVHYRPAGRTGVGGDFYDVVPLPDGRLVMVVGDVMGRGVAAAAAMAQVRASVRAYVAIDPSPALVLDRLSILFETVEVPQLVTVLYAVVDPVAGTVDVLSAGHLPAFVVRPGGEVDQLDVESSPPLGAGVFVRGVGRFAVGRGDVLLMVTDGLVERRGEDIDAGMARLAGEAAGLAQDVSDDRLTQIADVLREQGHDDDVTLLAVRRAGPGYGR